MDVSDKKTLNFLEKKRRTMKRICSIFKKHCEENLSTWPPHKSPSVWRACHGADLNIKTKIGINWFAELSDTSPNIQLWFVNTEWKVSWILTEFESLVFTFKNCFQFTRAVIFYYTQQAKKRNFAVSKSI